MIYVLDTHPIIWFVENDQRLSITARDVMQDRGEEFVVPTIVLAEIRFLCEKGRITADLFKVYHEFINTKNCVVSALDETVISLIPPGLNIHDSIIVATALVYRDIYQQSVTLITKDDEIRRSGLVPTLW